MAHDKLADPAAELLHKYTESWNDMIICHVL
jgi:hypothetical protein